MAKRALQAAAGMLLLIAVYAFAVEPNWLDVTRHELRAAIPEGLKIAHLTDLHIEQFGRREKKVLTILEQEQPDLIVITGDMISSSLGLNAFQEFSSQLSAPLGVWAVNGNWERWALDDANQRDLAGLAAVQLLNNDAVEVREKLWVVGLDDALAGRPDETRAFRKVPQNGFCIALFHSPEYFDRISGRCRLNLSGHTHGGQLRLPFVGPLFVPPGSGAYIDGWYENANSKMYVSRGVGTSIIPARFLSRPEIAFITLEAADE